MSEWKEYKLGEVTEPIKDTFNPDGSDDYAYIGLEHIEQESLRLNSIGVSSDVTSNKFLFKSNDILFGKLRPYFRKVVKPQFDGICSTDIWIFRAKEGFDQNYLYYFIANWDFVNTANSGEGGTRMPRADWNFLKTTEWNFPTLPEQIQITSILSSLDDKIDLLRRQNKTLKQLAETLFRQWFVEEAEKNWETIRICDVADINSRSISKNFLFSEIEYLDTGSITDGIIAGFQTYQLTDAPSRAQRIVKDNDIVYSLVRPIQRHYGLLNGMKPNTIVSTGFCVISCQDFSPHFLYILLTTSENIEYFDMIAEGATSTYPSLKPSDIANFEFQNPPKEKLAKFSKLASDYWNKINSNTNQIQILTQLLDTLLPKLIAGEVKVNLN